MNIPAAQAETAALLLRLAGGAPIETHISAVFVGAEEVWKLRKAVRMPFLDFSAVEERRRTALRELELNAPHAPGLYRDVVAVTRGADGAVGLGGEGEAVDWVVRMARVPPEDFFDAIAARGGLTPALLDALGDAVAAYHDALPPVAKDQSVVLRDIILGNRLSANAAGIDAAVVQSWTDGALAALQACEEWLRPREAAGYVRRAHGDLHLGNLCLWRGAPAPFDALEFSEELAIIDLGYDFSFLLMDLDTRVGRDAANRVLNRYLARTGDCGLVRGLPLFQSVRAMVRAHIAAARGQHAECRTYLDHAFSYLSPTPAMVVAIGGLMGTGKTTLARALAPRLGAAPGALVLRSDEIRKRIFGVAPEAKLPRAAYSADASREVFAAMARGVAAAGGHTVIADATFMDPRLRQAVRRAAGSTKFFGVWLRAPLPELDERVAGRQGDDSDADVAVLRRAARHDPGPGDWLAVDATDAGVALTAVRAAVFG